MSVRIEIVERPHKHREFIQLPWRINAGDPDFVPPLMMALKKQLNPAKYPFFNHGSAQFLIARRDGRAVGRLAAIDNRLHTETYNDGVGFFGLFECDDDQEAARALFSHGAAWCRERGHKSIRGPLNYSVNDENAGVLIKGEGPPMVMMSYNPRYYGRLIEDCGLTKCVDLYAWLAKTEVCNHDRFRRITKLMARRTPELKLRGIRKRGAGYLQDIRTMLDIFNRSWAENWGFLKVTDPEVDAIAADLKPIVRPEFTAIAEIDGEPVGMAVFVPNINEILIKIPSGRLFPFGWYKMLTGLGKIRACRTMLMGVLPEYRGRGVDGVLIARIIANCVKNGIRRAEMSWILEDNTAMNSLAEKIPAENYRTYRLYEAAVDELIDD